MSVHSHSQFIDASLLRAPAFGGVRLLRRLGSTWERNGSVKNWWDAHFYGVSRHFCMCKCTAKKHTLYAHLHSQIIEVVHLYVHLLVHLVVQMKIHVQIH